MWTITNLVTLEQFKSKTVEEWQLFVANEDWGYYSVIWGGLK